MDSPENIDLTNKLKITLKDVLMLFSFFTVVISGWIRLENQIAVQKVQINQLEKQIDINSLEVKNIDQDLDEIKEGMYRILGQLESEENRDK